MLCRTAQATTDVHALSTYGKTGKTVFTEYSRGSQNEGIGPKMARGGVESGLFLKKEKRYFLRGVDNC